jgi:NAD(P)-dependent dehydrogenase (short-subunit alcohol dehydrogenase family)
MTCTKENTAMEISVKGLRVHITAAASGIGCAFAKAFLEKGARVHICDIRKDMLEDCTNNLTGIGVTEADVSDPVQVDRLFEEAVAHLGGLDVLVNNAGIFGAHGRRRRRVSRAVGSHNGRKY